MYKEEDFLPISAVQHFAFCRRQCALIHLEQVWEENYFTAQGRNLHERVDQGGERPGRNLKIEYSVPLRSFRLGLVGKADVVEFHRLHEKGEIWVPYPVEYKRGRPKIDNSDKVQLCAQAICLEEMTGVDVKEGALFYGKMRRRVPVMFDAELRDETERLARQLHRFILQGETPPPEYSKKCERCSLLEICMPKTIDDTHTVKDYLRNAVERL